VRVRSRTGGKGRGGVWALAGLLVALGCGGGCGGPAGPDPKAEAQQKAEADAMMRPYEGGGTAKPVVESDTDAK
jgi:hypothetical protein